MLVEFKFKQKGCLYFALRYSDHIGVIPPYTATTVKPQLYPTPSLSTEHAH